MVYGVPVVVTPETGRLEPTLAEITQSVSSYTRAIVINSPNNPSGAVYSHDFMAELVDFCERKGIYLITDDIYHRLVFNDGVWTPAFKFAKKDIEDSHVIAINGVSKSYAMTGFRLGWTVAPSDITAAMINVSAQNTSCPPVVTQVAAVGALNGVQSGVEALRLTLENNAKVMVNELKAFSSVRLIEPQGTFYCLPDFSAYEKDSLKLSRLLLEKARVVTVPGKEFGLDGHLRLSYCGTIKDIKQGIERIKWALDPEAPNEIYIGDRKFRRDWK
jgi:aspartate aminotransferase